MLLIYVLINDKETLKNASYLRKSTKIDRQSKLNKIIQSQNGYNRRKPLFCDV